MLCSLCISNDFEVQELLSDEFSVLQYAFNLFSHNASVLSNGYNEEEMKLVKETRKIWVSRLVYCFYFYFYHIMTFFVTYFTVLLFLSE
jgi:aspartate-semialdehyde dehydrogenase